MKRPDLKDYRQTRGTNEWIHPTTGNDYDDDLEDYATYLEVMWEKAKTWMDATNPWRDEDKQEDAIKCDNESCTNCNPVMSTHCDKCMDNMIDEVDPIRELSAIHQQERHDFFLDGYILSPLNAAHQCALSFEKGYGVGNWLHIDELPHEDRACPCNYGEPCDERCTCVNPTSSTGCNNCCTYGSLEQREAKADHLKLKTAPEPKEVKRSAVVVLDKDYGYVVKLVEDGKVTSMTLKTCRSKQDGEEFALGFNNLR